MIKKWFGKKKPPRCGTCKKKRGNRDCLRFAGKICWQDCNKIRIGLKCPAECSYALSSGSFTKLKAKVDSQTEYSFLQKLLLDKWLINFDEELNGIPIELIKTKPENLKAKIKAFSKNPLIDINYLNKRLGFDLYKNLKPVLNPENIAEKYLGYLLKYDYENMLKLKYNNKLTEDEFANFVQRHEKNKFLKKINDFKLILSASNQNKTELLVLFEINFADNLCVYLKQKDDEFKVVSIFRALPEFFAALPDMRKQVAEALAKNSAADAEKLIKGFLMMFFEDADLHYYKGILHTLRQEDKQSINEFFTAIELDKKFYEAMYSLAFVYHRQKKSSQAKKWYLKVLEIEQNHINTLNNLAAIYEEDGFFDKAKQTYEKCLEINPNFDFAIKNIERINKK